MSDKLELPDTSPRDARLAAMRMLTRREYSRRELIQKLKHKGFNATLIEQIADDLAQEGLLSDERFAESFLRSRMNKGYGPVRVRHELQQRGVSEEIIAATIVEEDPAWFELVRKVREKRFGARLPGQISDKLKQQKFLQYRGFTQQHLRYAMSEESALSY
jgi:regulatory protein